MTHCADATPHLLSLGMGTLAPPERTWVEAHLGRCSSCSSYLAGVEAALEQKRASRWTARRPGVASAPPRPKRSWRLRKGRTLVAMAALVGLAVALSLTPSAETEGRVLQDRPVELRDPIHLVEGITCFDPVEVVPYDTQNEAIPVADSTQAQTIEIDLVTGRVTGSNPFVTFVAAPRDTNGDAYCEAVLAVDMETFAGFDLRAEYTGEPHGFSLNVGDSRTNNGCAGDGATQSNDAEFQIRGSEFTVWGNDYVPASERNLAKVAGIVQKGGHVEFTVADGHIGWGYGGAAKKQLRSPYLFALSGQADDEGPVNHDVYLAFNRVVSGSYRSGSGLGKVTIRLIPLEGCK